MLTMPKAGADFELAPDGTHLAVCYRVVDLGTQPTTYKGETRHKHVILISWELSEELMQDGRPFTIGKRYTYSSHKKAALRQDLESWRGRAFTEDEFGTFDIGNLIGVNCLLNVVHDYNERTERTYANIVAIMRPPKGSPMRGSPINPSFCFSLADRPFDHATFGELSERVQEIIKQSPEYKAAIEGRDPNEEPPAPSESDYGAGRPFDDPIEIPF